MKMDTKVSNDVAGPDRDAVPVHDSSRRRWLPIVLGAAAVVVVVMLILWIAGDGDGDEGGEVAHIGVQGDIETSLVEDGAELSRGPEGVVVAIEMPRPEPATYEYPTGDMVPPWAAPHPAVSPGSSQAPEVFTSWLFVFNHPERCTDEACDLDDIGVDTEAQGGSYQVDGLVADSGTMNMAGRIRTGQEPANGARLQRPMDAEVHIAIAPHGRGLDGEDLWRQLNGPIGNPTLWWGASFYPDSQ